MEDREEEEEVGETDEDDDQQAGVHPHPAGPVYRYVGPRQLSPDPLAGLRGLASCSQGNIVFSFTFLIALLSRGYISIMPDREEKQYCDGKYSELSHLLYKDFFVEETLMI